MTQYQTEPTEIRWTDGRPASPRFEDHYWAIGDPFAEKAFVFPGQHDLAARWQTKQHFTIVELGFGFGHNFLATVEAFLQAKPSGILTTLQSNNSPFRARRLINIGAREATHWVSG